MSSKGEAAADVSDLRDKPHFSLRATFLPVLHTLTTQLLCFLALKSLLSEEKALHSCENNDIERGGLSRVVKERKRFVK